MVIERHFATFWKFFLKSRYRVTFNEFYEKFVSERLLALLDDTQREYSNQATFGDISETFLEKSLWGDILSYSTKNSSASDN